MNAPVRRFVTVMVHKDGAVESHTVRLPLWLVRILVGATSTVVGLWLLGVALYGPIVRTAARVPGMEREIARLTAENRQVTQLAAQLAQVEQRYEQVRTMLGGNIVPPRPTGTGPLSVTYPVAAREPGQPRTYERGPSIPTHWPLDEAGVVTRGQVGGGGDDPHPGLDVAVPMGTPIRAAGGGTVGEAGDDPEYGHYILVNHPDGYQSMYGHASRLLVVAGQFVPAGEVIGLSGSTGRSTAPHLHFEIRREGRAIDPRSIVRREF
jgi:murein DD-endopeptidase MepM/ murein hydrolase activator NlpD